MREVRQIMGMPITIAIEQKDVDPSHIEVIFDLFSKIDERFSTYKDDSEIMRINRGEITSEHFSKEMKEIFTLANKTQVETKGYFNINRPNGMIDPSGIVKSWAIHKATGKLKTLGYTSFFIDAGSDVQVVGTFYGKPWNIGIRNPFEIKEIVKVLMLIDASIATSGNYERGPHIYNPINPSDELKEIVSISVIGSNIIEADRFATAAYAMGKKGISFIESVPGLEGYSIDRNAIATMTSGFSKYTQS